MSVNDKACWLAYMQYASCVLKGTQCNTKYKQNFINKGCTQDNIDNYNIASFSTNDDPYADDRSYCEAVANKKYRAYWKDLEKRHNK